MLKIEQKCELIKIISIHTTMEKYLPSFKFSKKKGRVIC
jgi:hypothetical protein